MKGIRLHWARMREDDISVWMLLPTICIKIMPNKTIYTLWWLKWEIGFIIDK